MNAKNDLFHVTIESMIEQFQKIDHLLIDILVISVCAIIASAQT